MSAADEPTPPLNSQVKQAVQATYDAVLGPQGAPAKEAGAAIAYQKVAQAAALRVQDATDYQRNIMSISTVAQGQALAKMFSAPPESVAEYAPILILAMLAPFAASMVATQVDGEATAVANTFPPGA